MQIGSSQGPTRFENARGVILRVRRLTESSLIVHWLTAESGRISTVAKGALRPKSAFGGKLDIFHVADFGFSRSRRSDLHTLREVRLAGTFPLLRTELKALQQAAYCATFLEQTTEADTPLPGMYEMFVGFLGSLRADEGGRLAGGSERVLAFELRLLAVLGLEPDWEESRLPAESRAVVEHLAQASWEEISRTTVPPASQQGLRRFLQGFLIYNFGRLAKGREAALAQDMRMPARAPGQDR